MWLVDTSAWVELFRRHTPLTLDTLVDDPDAIVTCLPVIQEVLQGFGDDRHFEVARSAMRAFPCVESPLGPVVVDESIDLYRRARRAGLTVRSSVDCLVAACALRHQLTVVHCDRDFASIARVASLRHIDIRPRLGRARRG